MEQDLKIVAEPQMNPESCKFIVDSPFIVNGPSVGFDSPDRASGSKLAETIFATGNVARVFVSGPTLTVTQIEPEDWRVMGKRIGGAIRQAIASGVPLVSNQVQEKISPPETIRQKVVEVLDRMINPAIASHGGVIELIDVRYNDVFIRMSGGCQGCAASMMTLKQGVERTLREEIPDIGAIYDTTDHAAGQNPYYSPAH